MKITQESIDDLNVILKVDVTPEDYQDKTDKILRNYRKDAVVPGFRKGKTPMGIINKKYKIPVLIEEINKLIQSEIYKYINDKKVKILGSPIPKSDIENDWKNETNFHFEFEIGLAPLIHAEITEKDQITYYKIEVDKKLIDKYSNDIAKRFGKMSNPKTSKEGDLIFCEITQVDLEGKIIANGINNKATVSMDFINDQKIKQKFIGVKKDDVFIVDVTKAFTNNTDLSSMLNVKHEDLDNLKSKEFQFKVENISKLEAAELNQELFDKVYGKDSVKTKKEFFDRIKEEASHSFVQESNKMFKNDVVHYLLNKHKIQLPDAFLKKWLVQSSKKEVTLDQIESEYAMYSKSLKWQLIENSILDLYKVKVSTEEVENHMESLITMQMQQYGQPIPSQEKMKEIMHNILQKEDEKKKVYDQLYDIKTLQLYKENFKLKEKPISYDDFVKLASEK